MPEERDESTINLDRFWNVGAEFSAVNVHVQPPAVAAEILKQLGPSPFPRGGFPIIGFLASAYEKVSRYALERDTECTHEGQPWTGTHS